MQPLSGEKELQGRIGEPDRSLADAYRCGSARGASLQPAELQGAPQLLHVTFWPSQSKILVCKFGLRENQAGCELGISPFPRHV